MSSWLKTALPLDRPEYSKQTEALLTDLLWRSPGSSLHVSPDSSLFEEHLKGRKSGNAPLDRVVYAKAGQKTQKVVDSLPFARLTDVSSLVVGDAAAECLHAMLETLRAPRSRSYRSISCVPLHPDLVALQTLPGIVNKQSPPNVARIIEEVGRMGGGDGIGAIAYHFLRASGATQARPEAGITGCANAMFPQVASQVWAALDAAGQPAAAGFPAWPGVTAQPYAVDTATSRPSAATLTRTPFRWFWHKWSTLCDPANKWVEVLPQRRWVDWALSLLRTALAFTYLWEAELFIRIRDCLVERRNGTEGGQARQKLIAFLDGQFNLALVQPGWVPPAQKRVWDAISSNLGKGYAIRKELDSWMEENASSPADGPFADSLLAWIDSLASADLARLAAPIVLSPSTANNTKEFVKYLLLPRSADDDASDQGDLYFLARSNRSSFWIELGPEWLVVETSLLAQVPGGKCTLRQLVDDLAMLGVVADRRTFVRLLEDAGLSSDSPDADEALVIESGF